MSCRTKSLPCTLRCTWGTVSRTQGTVPQYRLAAQEVDHQAHHGLLLVRATLGDHDGSYHQHLVSQKLATPSVEEQAGTVEEAQEKAAPIRLLPYRKLWFLTTE